MITHLPSDQMEMRAQIQQHMQQQTGRMHQNPAMDPMRDRIQELPRHRVELYDTTRDRYRADPLYRKGF